jgi:ABC-type hemin transport system substrate-binding protein
MEHLRNACDSVLAEDTLSRLDVVTVKEDEYGLYLAELLVVVKEGKAPHYFNAAGHTEANARIRMQGVLNDATSLMRALGAETSTVNKIRDIAETLRVGAKAEAIKEILKAQISVALGTSSDGGAS